MYKRVSCLVLVVAWAGVAAGARLAPNHSSLSENLCLWLRMPEVNYDPATETWIDLSGKGNDAQAIVDGFVGPTLSSGENATVFAHPFGAVHFDPAVQELLKAADLNGGAGLTELTIFSVQKVVDPGAVDQRAVGFGSYNDGGRADHFDMSFDVTVRKDNGRIEGKNQDHPLDAFVIYVARMDPATINMWLNSTGTLSLAFTANGSSYATSNDQFYVGDLRYPDAGDFDVAEVVVFNTALTDEQIEGVSEWLQAYVGIKAKTAAFGGNPADEAVDISRDIALSWNPVETAVQRDVYFGTVFDDVNEASRTDPLDVLLSQGQTATTFDPGRLEFGQTYYWRIDEVNGAPDNTIFKGDVWSFTTELIAYPIETVVATTNAVSDDGAGPENMVNGSGLNADDQHSVDSDDMWLAASADNEPITIEFAFDRVYELHQMLVWNYNVAFEPLLGFGVKTATIEYSADGIEWASIGDVELAQGTALDTYAANTAVDFGDVAAQYVRLTVVSGYGVMGKFGLSEVRFLAIPVYAGVPQPVEGATNVSVDANLSWKAGRKAALHEVSLGADPDALTLLDSATEAALEPGPLDLGTTYYWRVDEVNDAEATAMWVGSLWHFTTEEYIVVEDFESYDDEDNRIYDTWIDGWVNETGSMAGHLEAPFAEKTMVHGGGQSMPLYYENTNGLSVAEAERTFGVSQNWSQNGIQSLSLFVYGNPDNDSGQLYLKINDTKVAYTGVADVLQRTQWVPWTVDLAATGANLSNVTSLTIGIEGSGITGLIYVDDIRLYPQAAELIEPTAPDDSDPNLMAYYQFEGNADDSTGNYPGEVVGEPEYTAGKSGQAIALDPTIDYVVCTFDQDVVWPAYSVSLWVRTDTMDQDTNSSLFNNNSSANDFQIDTDGTSPGNYRYQGTSPLEIGPVSAEWVHLAVTCDGASNNLYYDGLFVGSLDVADTQFGQIAIGINRAGDNQFGGVIDELRLYNRAVSDAEVLGLAGVTVAVPKGF